jgi:hypothetical protein
MLDEQEFAAGFEDPGDLSKSALLVHHTTEHQCADHEIYTFVRGWQHLGGAVAKLNLQVQAVSLFDQVRFHVWVCGTVENTPQVIDFMGRTGIGCRDPEPKSGPNWKRAKLIAQWLMYPDRSR